jgi:hypothetical protein
MPAEGIFESRKIGQRCYAISHRLESSFVEMKPDRPGIDIGEG